MKIRYHPDALAELDAIRRYIARDNPDAAWVVASFIRRSIKSLEEWPHSGRATGGSSSRTTRMSCTTG
jgi:plasmid stabilization system protein ParE